MITLFCTGVECSTCHGQMKLTKTDDKDDTDTGLHNNSYKGVSIIAVKLRAGIMFLRNKGPFEYVKNIYRFFLTVTLNKMLKILLSRTTNFK